MTSGQWAVQKRYGAVFDPFSVRFGSVPFVSLRFEPLVSKRCFLPIREAWFCKTTFNILHQTNAILDPQVASTMLLLSPLVSLDGPWSLRKAIFAAFVAPWNLQNSLGKCVFFCLGPLMHDFVHASHMQSCKFRVPSAIFSSWQWFAHPLFANFEFFWLKMLRFFSKVCFSLRRGA